MNKLPIYRAVIDNEEAGMVTISLVDFPATQSDFIAFEKEKELVKFSIENEEKHLVRGLVMAANMLIYRVHPLYGEYYIYYDAETLRTMAERYLKNNFQNNVDLNHNGDLVEGVDMVQFFIKDSENGINPKNFEDYADGSLFAEFHINNEEVWEQVKNGDFNGFSLEGYFGIEPTGYEFKKETNNNEEKYKKTMSKLSKIKEALRSLLIEFGEVSTDKGVITFDGDELEAGLEVRGIDEEGNEIPVTVYGRERLALALEMIGVLEENGILGNMASVDVTDLGALTMWYGSQYKVLLGDKSRLDYKIGAMNSAISQFGSYDTGTLDVRFTVSATEVILSPFKED